MTKIKNKLVIEGQRLADEEIQAYTSGAYVACYVRMGEWRIRIQRNNLGFGRKRKKWREERIGEEKIREERKEVEIEVDLRTYQKEKKKENRVIGI